jgi:hypothetical protein
MKCELLREYSARESGGAFWYRKVMRLVVAAVLVLSAGVKLADIPEFLRGVMLLSGLSRSLAGIAGVLVLMLELGIGMYLLVGHRPRLAMFCGGGLLFLFAGVLTSAVIRQAAGRCGCFGALGPHLPYRYQALADLALAAGTFASAGIFPRRGTRPFLLILGIWGASLIAAPESPEGASDSEGSLLAGGRGGDVPLVLLLADFSDFGCQLCLDDFLALCDSLDVRASSGSARVRLLARRDSSRGVEAQARFLSGWAKGNGYGFSVGVELAGEFGLRGVTRSTIFVERANGEVIARGSFPLGRERRMEILQLL